MKISIDFFSESLYVYSVAHKKYASINTRKIREPRNIGIILPDVVFTGVGIVQRQLRDASCS